MEQAGTNYTGGILGITTGTRASEPCTINDPNHTSAPTTPRYMSALCKTAISETATNVCLSNGTYLTYS